MLLAWTTGRGPSAAAASLDATRVGAATGMWRGITFQTLAARATLVRCEFLTIEGQKWAKT